MHPTFKSTKSTIYSKHDQTEPILVARRHVNIALPEEFGLDTGSTSLTRFTVTTEGQKYCITEQPIGL
jgi:hypothetical protein